MSSAAALAKVVPVLLVLAAGQGLRRARLLSASTVADLKALVFKVTLPCLLVNAFSRVDLQPRTLVPVAVVFAAALAVYLVAGALQRRLPGLPPSLPALLTGFEAGMFGFAMFSSVHGAENVWRFFLADLGQALVVYFAVVPGLEAGGARRGPGRLLRGFLGTPAILAILGGLALRLTGLRAVLERWPLGGSVFEALALLGGATTALVTLVVGWELRLRPGSLRRPALTALARLGLWAGLGAAVVHFVIDRWLGLDRLFQAAFMTLFVLPPPFVYPIFLGEARREEQEYVADTIALGTLLTLGAFTLVTVAYAG
jgi:malate permease and related proteins